MEPNHHYLLLLTFPVERWNWQLELLWERSVGAGTWWYATLLTQPILLTGWTSNKSNSAHVIRWIPQWKTVQVSMSLKPLEGVRRASTFRVTIPPSNLTRQSTLVPHTFTFCSSSVSPDVLLWLKRTRSYPSRTRPGRPACLRQMFWFEDYFEGFQGPVLCLVLANLSAVKAA